MAKKTTKPTATVNTSSEKVGGLITRLFSEGFSHEAIQFLVSPEFAKHNEREITLTQLLEQGFCNSFSKYNSLEKKFEAIRDHMLGENSNLETIDRRYILPPSNPFDMFALCSTLLLKSGAYHHIEYNIKQKIENISPNERNLNRAINIIDKHRKQNDSIAEEWLNSKDILSFYLPNNKAFNRIKALWVQILDSWRKPVHILIDESQPPPNWWYPAYALVAISDHAAKSVGFMFCSENGSASSIGIWPSIAQKTIVHAGDLNQTRKIGLFGYVESLSLADRSIVNVMPKARTAAVGCTLRGLTHNLANLPGRGTIRTGWGWAERDVPEHKRHIFNMLLIPYPYEIHSTNFRAVSIDSREDVRFGKFSVAAHSIDGEDEKMFEYVESLIREANTRTTGVHAVVFPELALKGPSVKELLERIASNYPSVELFCSGVRSHPDPKTEQDEEIPLNGAFMATFGQNEKDKDGHATSKVHQQLFHEKHHPWKLTESQILQYNLSASLDPSRTWIEDLHVVNRRLPFLVMRETWTVTTLICEDLARNDPARPVVESIGPNLIISLLMDGPQIPSRWSAKYANVLAEDPGSAVLSMTSFGLINRSSKPGPHTEPGFPNKTHPAKECRTFGLWRDDKKTVAIDLDNKSDAVLISLSEYPVTDFTMDGRSDSRSKALRLTGIRQIRLNSGERRKCLGEAHNHYPRWGTGKPQDSEAKELGPVDSNGSSSS